MISRKNVVRVLINLLVIVVAAAELYPFLVMLMGSFKSAQELSANPAGFPDNLTLNNYVRLFKYNGGMVAHTFLNSVFISITYVILTVFVSALAAYAFSKYKFKGRDIMFVLLLTTIMVPIELLIPPQYIIFSKLGWLNSYQIQILPFVAHVPSMFMIRQYMLSMSDSLLDSARIDGAGEFRIFFNIAIPIAVPALSAVAIIQFLHKWNDFVWPVIMVDSFKYLPITVIIPNLNDNGDLFSISWELILAGCVIVTVPILVVFCMFQEKIMESVTIGAVKG